MMNKTPFATALTAVAVAFLAGCATDIEPTEDEASSAPVAALADEADDVAPAATNTGGTGCTTTKTCDKDYCCTTETCRFSTIITCVPAPKKTTTTTAAFAP